MFKISLKLCLLLALLLAACGSRDTALPTSPTEPAVPPLDTAVSPTQAGAAVPNAATPAADRVCLPRSNSCRGYLDEVLWGQSR